MLKFKKKKRSLTLIEMIVVMVLIATISGAIAYNYKQSLNEGKAFKSREMKARIQEAINLEIMQHPEKFQGIKENWKTVLKHSPFITENSKLQGGWGEEFDVDPADSQSVVVTSKRLDEYEKGKK